MARRPVPGLIPQFAQPVTSDETPESPTAAMSPDPAPSSNSSLLSPPETPLVESPTIAETPARPPSGSRSTPSTPRPEYDDTLTRTSTPGDSAPVPAAEKLTKPRAIAVVLGGVGVLFMCAAVGVRMRYNGARGLRMPTTEQSEEIAAPLANMLLRRAQSARRLPDLIDGLAVIGALGGYANEGALTYPKVAATEGMPQTGDQL